MTMKTIVLAYHNIGCAGIESLLKHGFDIAAVFTHADDPCEAVWFDSVAELAASRGIPVYAPENINHPLWVARIRSMAPDILFSFYYRQIVSPEILSIPEKGCLNLHGSLLPRYRGRAPINWVLVNGETETGVSLHYMTPKPDDGDLVGQTAISIHEDDTALTVHRKAVGASTALLDGLLPKIFSGTAPRIPQDASRASYFGGRTPADGDIDWNKDAAAVRNLVRAVTRPYPGAFSSIGDRRCTFWAVRVVPGGKNVPGTVVSTDPLIIACGEGAVEVLFGQSEGGVYMGGTQLASEMNLVPGMRFGAQSRRRVYTACKKHVLILGVDGFIGNHLSERLLDSGKYEVHGMDLRGGRRRTPGCKARVSFCRGGYRHSPGMD